MTAIVAINFHLILGYKSLNLCKGNQIKTKILTTNIRPYRKDDKSTDRNSIVGSIFISISIT